MNVIVNNAPREVLSDSVAGLIEELNVEIKGVAIALNGRVVARAQWAETRLVDGDKVVIVSAVFGG